MDYGLTSNKDIQEIPKSVLELNDARIVVKGDNEFESITEQKITIKGGYILDMDISHSDGTEIKYIRDNTFKISKDNKEIVNYTTTRGTLFTACRGILGEFRGTIIQKHPEAHSESVNRELFYYDNGALAYEISRTSETPLTTILYPNGQKWIEFTSNCNLNGTSLVIPEGEGDRWRSWGRGAKSPFISERKEDNNNGFSEQENTENQELKRLNFDSIRQLCKLNTFNYKEFNRKGDIITEGRVVNGQAVDIWRFKRNDYHYLSGVRVSEKLYNSTPEQLDPNEIINMTNAQLRSALLTKAGYANVIEKCKGKLIDKSGDMELISIPLKPLGKESWRRGDIEMKLLKVVCPSTKATYTLRVPPDMKECEQARQWTMLDTRGVPTKEDYIEFALET